MNIRNRSLFFVYYVLTFQVEKKLQNYVTQTRKGMQTIAINNCLSLVIIFTSKGHLSVKRKKINRMKIRHTQVHLYLILCQWRNQSDHIIMIARSLMASLNAIVISHIKHLVKLEYYIVCRACNYFAMNY